MQAITTIGLDIAKSVFQVRASCQSASAVRPLLKRNMCSALMIPIMALKERDGQDFEPFRI